MRFSLLTVTYLLGSAIATPITHSSLSERDTSVIESSFKRVTSSMSRLTNGFQNRPSGGSSEKAAAETDRLLALASDTLDEVRFSSREIRRGPNVNAFEAVGLLNMVNTLTKQIQTVVNGWIDAKRMVVAGGKKAQVLNTLLDASEASTNLGNAIMSKLPVLDRALANGFQQAFLMVYEQAIAEYKSK